MRLNAGGLGSSEELCFLLLRKGLDVLSCFFLGGGLCYVACRILVPCLGIEPGPGQ